MSTPLPIAPDARRDRLHVAYRAVLLAAALVAAGLLIHELVGLLVGIVATIIVAIVLSAGAARLARFGLPRAVGAMLTLIALVAVLVGLCLLIIPPLVSQTEKLVDDAPRLVDDLYGKYGGAAGSDRATSAGDKLQRSLEKTVNDPGKIVGPLAQIGIGVVGAIASVLFVLLTAFYMAAQPRPLLEGVLRLFPPERRPWAAQVMDRLREAWIGWLRGVAVDMVVTGVLLYIGLTLVGLDYAVLFAVLSSLLVVVPYFGAVVGGIPPVLLALTESPELALLTLAVYVLVQQIEGNVIVPLVMAQTVKLHPAVIAIGVVLVGQLFGYVGLLVAVPILSTIVILVDETWVRRVEEAPPDAAEELAVVTGRSGGAVAAAAAREAEPAQR
jgi:predicted PurR-regulated permease PerM